MKHPITDMKLQKDTYTRTLLEKNYDLKETFMIRSLIYMYLSYVIVLM